MADTASLQTALQATLERLIDSRLASLRRELAGELQKEISSAVGGLHAPAAPASPALPSPSGGFSELNLSIARILQPTGQTEVIGACLQSAAAYAGRCALFVRRGDAFVFWRAERFRDEAAAALRSLTIPANQPGIFKDLVDTQRALCRKRAPGVIPAILDRALGESAEASIFLLPIVVQGKIVAALYADAGSVAASVDAAALEILAKVTGLTLETAAMRSAAAASRALAAATPPTAPAQAAESVAGSEPSPGAPPPQPSPPPDAADPLAAAGPSPLPGSFAASIPVTTEAVPSVPPPPDTENLPEEEREPHRKAHRFARVAVQDLLSYHKNKIEQGRISKNLYTLLKEDIEKTRENYRQRFGNTPARSFDYLHYELVLKLADNDPQALGAQYPGAMQGE